MGIIEPFDLSKEERQKFHVLLDRLMEAIEQKVEQPKPRSVLRVLPPLSSEVITQMPEHDCGENIGDGEMSYTGELKAVALDLLATARDMVTALDWLIGNVPSPAWPAEMYDLSARLAAARAAVKRAEARREMTTPSCTRKGYTYDSSIDHQTGPKH